MKKSKDEIINEMQRYLASMTTIERVNEGFKIYCEVIFGDADAEEALKKIKEIYLLEKADKKLKVRTK